MRQRDRFLYPLAVFAGEYVLHIDGIGMANRDRRLQPFQQYLELAPKWIGARFELTEIEHSSLFYNG